ncbi:MAG: 4-(cytidine 5'-diphospho)-2-C-methyl-D-erythritol kinase [Rhodanobacter sp.]
MQFSIEPAVPAQVDALCAIERAALELFRGHRAWSSYADMPIPPALLHRAVNRGLVWAALDADASAVGFVWLDTELAAGGIGISEINVLPSHGRRGIGAALLEHACAWAREAGYDQVDLGTLADVPWNAPFYARHGFRAAAADDAAFASARARDRANGFPADLRVYMRRPLAPRAGGDWSVWPAPAKLNLFLRISGRRADGYHNLQTVFRLLDWGDEIRLRVRTDGVLQRVGGVPGVPADADLTLRAARALREHAGVTAGADIELRKRIPMGGGLGGGSSDAATVLLALNALWGIGLDEEALAGLGRALGADVPVFVRGRSAWAEGVGERLTPLALPRRHYVVVDPHVQVPTAALFQAAELTRNAPAATISSFVSGETVDNAFAPVARARYPAVAAAMDWLGRFGLARLSGSGGSVFLETGSFDRALAVARQCPSTFTARAVSGLAASPVHATLARLQRTQ